ncbi:carboxymuconolactone decarboxylase family protein [Acidovorax sp. GBBC 3334]|uniref:carboxymuconolactone decarboxylase family protein n=1 Tax=Acidovorax sp. GBBC 3334 TaxID=2940496 RepID=UPI00230330E1|nr:carboxymuconolactone decarboxylase family protein [Acidovorax sp. GBBC 3334]MDA8456344.1 carboxymuconolactone decarboxylase family protein [Acidovorax sp. GBBC 3334]
MSSAPPPAQRIDLPRRHAASYHAMFALQKHVNAGALPTGLHELVKMRASQINGCAFCIDLHARVAREHGESDRRLHLLAAWGESGAFDARECAALAWTEALTLVASSQVPDSVYAEVSAQFTEAEIVELSMAIVAINGWNRLMVAFRTPPGGHAVA